MSRIRMCKTCKVEKEILEFYPKKGNYYTHSCKLCLAKRQKRYKNAPPEYHRERSIKTKYDLTLDQYEQLRKEQGNRCAICRTPQSELKSNLAVDHCHRTGKIRGLLCVSCNLALGNFKDSISNVEDALFYLILHK